MSRCSNCGAELHAADGDQTCRYCGADLRGPAVLPERERAALPDPVPIAPRERRALAPPGRRIGYVGAASAVIVVSIVGILLWNAQRRTDAGAASTSSQTRKPKLTLAALATTPFSYEPIDAPGMLGEFTSFDPIANYEWARSIGRAWKADAVLYRLDVDRVAKDGTVDVKNVPKAEAMYRFYSPACSKERSASTAVVAPTTKCGLYVEILVEGGSPTALVNSVDADSSLPAPLSSPVCTLAKAFSALASAGKLPERPVYDVSVLGHATPRAGRVDSAWTISDIQHQTTAYVDATSCAIR